MPDNLLSVIIPAYNVDKWIGKCIESVIGQTYKNLEIIVVNDGSTDKTIDICREYADRDSRIKLIDQDNQGVVRARKAGVNASCGEWITFVDGDDWIEADMYEHMSGHMLDCDLVTCGVMRETKTESMMILDEFPNGKYEGEDFDYFLSHMIYDFEKNLPQALKTWLVNKIFRASILKEVINSCDIDDVTFAEDTVIVYSYLLRCKSAYIGDEYFYNYVYREGSALHKVNSRVLLDIDKIYRVLEKVFTIDGDSHGLVAQLEKWITILLCQAPRGYMGFDEAICPIQYLLDTRCIDGKRIALYGAGKCGKDYYRQMSKYGMEPVLWLDAYLHDYIVFGKDVYKPDALLSNDYDGVLIAVSEENLADSIRNSLIKLGVDNRKIMWQKPLTSF